MMSTGMKCFNQLGLLNEEMQRSEYTALRHTLTSCLRNLFPVQTVGVLEDSDGSAGTRIRTNHSFPIMLCCLSCWDT